MFNKYLLTSFILAMILILFTCGSAKPVEEEGIAPPSRIAFISDRDGNREIYVMYADDSNQPADDTDPSWSPDGSRIAFTSNCDGNDEIYVMDADGSNQHPAVEGYTPIPTPTLRTTPMPYMRPTPGHIFILGILAWVLWLWLGKRMFRISRAAILAAAILQAVLAIAIYI